MGWRLIAVALALGVLTARASPASADGLSRQETQRLLRGESVARRQQNSFGDERYVGGVSYVILDSPADDVARLVSDPAVWKRVLPKTRSARAVGSAGGDALIEVSSGTLFLEANYTMRLRRESDGIKFWLDRARPHDVADAWGFLRVEPMGDGRSLVSYGVLIDVGNGIARDLFENPVRDLAMSVPDRLRDLVIERSAAGQRASR
jgi:carbon monoxide dehydrogenase subunit G